MKAERNMEHALHGGDSTTSPERAFTLGCYVVVRVEQRIPPERVEGEQPEWKYIGTKFAGRLMDGPNSVLSDPENGRYHYVAPLQKFDLDDPYDNLHPRQMEDGREYEVFDENTQEVTHVVRGFVEVAGEHFMKMVAELDIDEPTQK